ncbi:MAG: threonine synthase [Flavobacteriaceae bacterium]
MKFYSLNHKSSSVSFREATLRGIAPDRGLYFPQKIESLPEEIITNLNQYSDAELAYHAMDQFTREDIPSDVLLDMVQKVLQFPFPLVDISEQISVLELFHGPTMAFKDVGARFMAQCIGYFATSGSQETTVLVATSGDTGGAVARGFFGVEGVRVVILYPSGKVSDIQEKQLTTLGQNITALEVSGTFDDCQQMVKNAFLDQDLTAKLQLTSANSINVARWLPQQFYYFIACKALTDLSQPLVFSVPSGNFGNLCAGMVAQRLGLPISHFIAATNINDTVPKYWQTGTYTAQPSSPTISNAMDVGDPSNFIRILELFDQDYELLKKMFSSYSYTDTQTREAMKELQKQSGYIADPHGAVGYLGLKQFLQDHPEYYGVFLETAHPVKFLDVVEQTLGIEQTLPRQIAEIVKREKQAIPVDTYSDLKEFLLSS